LEDVSQRHCERVSNMVLALRKMEQDDDVVVLWKLEDLYASQGGSGMSPSSSYRCSLLTPHSVLRMSVSFFRVWIPSAVMRQMPSYCIVRRSKTSYVLWDLIQ
jgi:hypothetical protein